MQEPEQLFRDLINIEMVAMLNEAFCELHHKPYCPPSEELTRECGKVSSFDTLLYTLVAAASCSFETKDTVGLGQEGRGDDGVYLGGIYVQIKP